MAAEKHPDVRLESADLKATEFRITVLAHVWIAYSFFGILYGVWASVPNVTSLSLFLLVSYGILQVGVSTRNKGSGTVLCEHGRGVI